MPFPFLAIGIMFAITGLMTALSYVMRPKMRKPDAFDSPQYSFFGLSNQYGPGTPNNTIYGEWMKIAPNIISWYKRRDGDNMYAYILTEIGFGVIGGLRQIKVNDQELIGLYKSRNRSLFDVYLTHGESKQKVYRYNRKVVRADVNSISEESPTGFHLYTVSYSLDNNQEDFQAATPAEPGYFLIYDNGDEDNDNETHELVMYTGKSGYTLTGCRLFKTHTVSPPGNAPRIIQEYSIKKNKAGNVEQVIPFFQSLTTNHTKVEQVVEFVDSNPQGNNGWTEVTTAGGIQRFSVVLSFYEGLYNIDSKDGSPNHASCDVAIRWYPRNSSWAPQYTEETKTRDKSTGTFTDKDGKSQSGSGNYIGLPIVRDKNNKRKYVNYCYCVDSGGDYVIGTGEDLNNNTRWDDIRDGKDWITFTISGITYEYIIKEVVKEDRKVFDDTIGQYVVSKVWKMKFLRPRNDESSADGKYYGPIPNVSGGQDFNPVSYTISFNKRTQSNLVVRTISARTFSEYQWTNTNPKADDDDTNDDEYLPYGKYKIAVKKLTPDKEDSSEGINKLRFDEVQEMTNDDLVYPNKALLGLKLLINDKVSGSIENITCKVAGKLVKDVQDTASSGSISTRANSTAYSLGNRVKPATVNGHYYMCVQAGTTASSIPAFPREARAIVTDGTVIWQEDSCRTSGNYEDIFADMVTSKLYGRGKYLEMSATDYTNFYAALSSDAAYCDQSITENGKTRKRMSVNFNIDFRKPLIDTLQAVSKNVRAYVYWDGKLLKNYIDRSNTADAMFGNVNIIPGTFELQTPGLADKINRFYTYFLNKKKDYVQDSVSRDYLDESFTADTLQYEEITLYGLTDRWRVLKLMAYLLKTSRYLDMVCKFETTMDGITTGIGKLFYLAHDTQSWGGQSGRVMTVPSTTQITIDRAYTFSNDPLLTYGVLLRKDDGTVIERVVNKSLTTLGSPTQTVYLTATISNISVNSIYILGRNDSGREYYKTFRCVKTKYKGNRIEIYGLKYDANIFLGIYSNDPVTAENAGTVVSNEDEETTEYLDDPKQYPPNVESVYALESGYEPGAIDIYIQTPLSTIWAYCNLYVQKDEDNVWRFVGKTTGDPLRASGLEIGKDYTVKAESWSHGGKANPDPVETSVYLDGVADNFLPGKVEGLKIYNARGNNNAVFGEDFVIGWLESSGVSGDGKSNNYLGHQNKNNANEEIRYQIDVYYEGFADTVKTKSGAQANATAARRDITRDNKYRYSLADNIEDTKAMFASTSPYYGVPQRIIGFYVYAINGYGHISEVPAYLRCTNNQPDMKDQDGDNTTPEVSPIKNGLVVEWQHPYQEYDITHFLVKVVQAYSPSDPDGSEGEATLNAIPWKPNTLFAFGALVYPTKLNGHVYRVITAGTSDATEPAWLVPNFATPHPTVVDVQAGLTFRHRSTFKANKIASVVRITSSDDDVAVAYYTWTVTKLDPKRSYIIRVTPYDAFGQGLPATDVTATPGLTHDDTIEYIRKTATPTGLAVALATTTSRDLRISWTAPSETDIRNAVIEVRYANRTTATVQPTLTEISNGVLSTGEACKATVMYVSTKSDQAFPTNVIFTGALTGWKYFFRIQFINSSEQSSDWSHGEADTWVSHSGTIAGMTNDDFDYNYKKFTYTGTWTSTDSDTVSWGAGTLKFLKSDGSTENYSISGSNTGNMSADGGWVVWQKSSPTVFSYVTSVGANQTPVAFCKPDTNKAFYAAFADTKEFMLTRSFVSAGTIVAGHMSVSSLSSMTADMGSLTAGEIKLSDNNDVRIYIDGDANPPVLRISKDGYEADSETNPDNLLFSSAYDYLKIEQSGWVQLDATTFPSNTVAANDFEVHLKYVSTSSISTKRIVFANLRTGDFSSPFTKITHKFDSDGIAWEEWDVSHQLDGSGGSQIVISRILYNHTSASYNFPATDSNYYMYWAIMTETQD